MMSGSLTSSANIKPSTPEVAMLIHKIWMAESAAPCRAGTAKMTSPSPGSWQRPHDDLGQVVKDGAPFFDSSADRGEIIVSQHHVGGLFGNVRARDAHRHANVGLLERGRIVTPSPVIATTWRALAAPRPAAAFAPD